MNEKRDKTQWRGSAKGERGRDKGWRWRERGEERDREGEIWRAGQTDRAIERRGEGSREGGEEEIWFGK